MALGHVLSGAAFPHYMHTDNAYQYAPGRSVASDWVNALLTKYSALSSLPVNTLPWDALGTYMGRRTGYMKSNVRAQLNSATRQVTITSPGGGPVYATGLQGGQATVYGGRSISYWNFSPNQALTVAVR